MAKFFRYAILTITLLTLVVAGLQAADFNLSIYVDEAYVHTSPDTLRNSGYSDVVKLFKATTMLVEFHNYQPLDSAYIMVEGSNNEINWVLLADSVLVQDSTDYSFIFPYAEVYLYYRGKINTDVGGADTTRTVVKFRAGGKTNDR